MIGIPFTSYLSGHELQIEQKIANLIRNLMVETIFLILLQHEHNLEIRYPDQITNSSLQETISLEPFQCDPNHMEHQHSKKPALHPPSDYLP